MNSSITIQGVEFTAAAAANIEEAGTDVALDILDLRSGLKSGKALLAECLREADDDRVHGWRDYVDAVVAAAAVARLLTEEEVWAAVGLDLFLPAARAESIRLVQDEHGYGCTMTDTGAVGLGAAPREALHEALAAEVAS